VPLGMKWMSECVKITVRNKDTWTGIVILYLFMQVKRRQSEADVDLRLQFLMNIELEHIKYLGI